MVQPRKLPVEVVVPLRWSVTRPGWAEEVTELTSYLAGLSEFCDITVVDGSDGLAREEHAAAWAPWARLRRPEGDGLNGKVVGCLTGLRAARHEAVVIADDDVRLDEAALRALLGQLADADLVRPQNVYDRWPWPARWDFARSLVARAVASDWPGTFALRRTPVLAVGCWSTEALFENLQLVRTAQAHGLRVVDAPWLVVARTPPTSRHFWSQRVRQAYDDLAQPGRLLTELAILPVLVLMAVWAPLLPAVAAAAVVTLGELGRRRHGTIPAPRTSALWCPLWVLERALCVWVAVGSWCRGGVRYHGRRVRHAALPVRSVAVPRR